VFGTPFEEPFTSIADLVGGSRLLAVGQVASPDAPGFPAIWTSTDGRSWEEVHRSVQAGSVIGVTEGGLGWAAVGLLEHPATGDRQSIPFPAYWESPDGMTWSQADLPLPDTAGGGVAQAVLNSVAGLLAVGSGEYPPPEAPGPVIGFAGWQATDADWEPAPLTEDFLEDIGGGFLLYQSADRVFAIGSGCRCGAGLPGRWWTTTDGRSWVQHAETPPILHTVIPFGDGLLAVGIEDGNGAIFLSE
jgi:hypothetical protein